MDKLSVVITFLIYVVFSTAGQTIDCLKMVDHLNNIETVRDFTYDGINIVKILSSCNNRKSLDITEDIVGYNLNKKIVYYICKWEDNFIISNYSLKNSSQLEMNGINIRKNIIQNPSHSLILANKNFFSLFDFTYGPSLESPMFTESNFLDKDRHKLKVVHIPFYKYFGKKLEDVYRIDKDGDKYIIVINTEIVGYYLVSRSNDIKEYNFYLIENGKEILAYSLYLNISNRYSNYNFMLVDDYLNN